MKYVYNVKFSWLFFLLIAFAACNGSVQKQEKQPEGLPVLDLEAAIEKGAPDTFVWNDIVKDAAFIPLSSDNNTLLSGSIAVCFMDDEYIIVADYQTASFYRFGIDGKVQQGFKFVGNGPGEYVHLTYLYTDPNHAFMDVYDDGNGKRIRYDWEGGLIGETHLKGMTAPCYISEEYGVLRGMPETEWQYFVTDSALNVYRKEVRLGEGYDEVKRSAVQILTSACQNRDGFILNRPMSDTVYQMTAQAMEPLFILKKGKYDLKYEDLGRFMTQEMKTMECLMWLNISSLPGYYLIDYKQKDGWYSEIWSKETRSVITRMKGKKGLPFRLPSGKELILPTTSLHILGKNVIVPIQASELDGEIDGVTADDNQVLLVMELL